MGWLRARRRRIGRIARWRSSGVRMPPPAALVGLVAALAVPSLAKPPPESLDPSASCVSRGCHPEIVAPRHLHSSELADECGNCHVQEGGAHAFGIEETPALCLNCHDDPTSQANVHEPASDDCLACHDPHGSPIGELLAAEDQPDLCFGCHDEAIVQEEYVHGPAEGGECTTCHDPHSSPFPRFLRAEGNQLCIQCHDDVGDTMEAASFVHAPAEDDCTGCHSPHSGPHPAMLEVEKKELCRQCHDDVVEVAEASAVDHAPVLEGDQCLTCHSPHASDHEYNLKESQLSLCLGCHDRAVRSGERMLLDVKRWLDKNLEWHTPIRESGCAACHQPHGGDRPRLLAASFPESFYTRFETGKYGLCFGCHEKSLVTAERTRGTTAFRDGDQNLHALHVDDAQRGRSCGACHDPHAASNPLQVRASVPFGQWAMPLDFQALQSGGSCLTGCHERKSYDRERK